MSKRVKKIVFACVAVLVVGAVATIAFTREKEIQVTAEQVSRKTIVETVSASGKIYPETDIRIGAGVTGEVTELFVKEGDSVKKGQVLARVKRENNNGNFSSLAGLIPGASVSSVGNNTISFTSPISGIVSVLSVRKGEQVGGVQMSATELMRIADMSRMELRVDVNENDIIKVNHGDSVDIEIEAYPRKKFRGIVSHIANSVQRGDMNPFSADLTSYQVRVLIDSSSYSDLLKNNSRSMPLRAGMNARAEIKTNTKADVLAVPISAVTTHDKQPATDKIDAADENVTDVEEVVYVINKEGLAEMRTVTTGVQDISNFEVLSGLKAGEMVITGPYTTINKGDIKNKKVKIVSREELYQKNE